MVQYRHPWAYIYIYDLEKVTPRSFRQNGLYISLNIADTHRVCITCIEETIYGDYISAKKFDLGCLLKVI